MAVSTAASESLASSRLAQAASACSMWLREGPAAGRAAEQVQCQRMQLPILLQPIGRVEQVDPADDGAQQPRVAGAIR